MKDEKRHPTINPALILDRDEKGIDFTFRGMNLWGNHSENMTQQQILEKFPFNQISVCWTFGPNPILENLSPIEAIWAGRLNEVLLLAKQKFPTLCKD